MIQNIMTESEYDRLKKELKHVYFDPDNKNCWVAYHHDPWYHATVYTAMLLLSGFVRIKT